MIEKELVVKDEVGLHARPASLFVKLAQESIVTHGSMLLVQESILVPQEPTVVA